MAAIFLDMCKIGKVIPVHKGGESGSGNYRLIFCFPVQSKMFWKILDIEVRKLLETNNIFLAKQHGYRQKHSKEITLGELVWNSVEIFDKKHKAIKVIIVLRNACDGVQHNILLSKLDLHGIKGQILIWVSSYLQIRKQ